MQFREVISQEIFILATSTKVKLTFVHIGYFAYVIVILGPSVLIWLLKFHTDLQER